MFCVIYRESNSHYSCRSQTQSIADKTEYIKQISGLLGSKDFRERIKGIDQLVADCQHNPNMVINSIFPVSTSALNSSDTRVRVFNLFKWTLFNGAGSSCYIIRVREQAFINSSAEGLPLFDIHKWSY